MSQAELIALGALFVALLSAVYSRRVHLTAKRANDIAVQHGLRPHRIAIYHAMLQFARFCSRYRTLQTVGAANGTRELVSEIEQFKWEIEQHGPLAMPAVEVKISEFQKKAWQLQRLLDRVAAGQDKPHDRTYASAEENIDAVVDWFAAEARQLQALFQPYLHAA